MSTPSFEITVTAELRSRLARVCIGLPEGGASEPSLFDDNRLVVAAINGRCSNHNECALMPATNDLPITIKRLANRFLTMDALRDAQRRWGAVGVFPVHGAATMMSVDFGVATVVFVDFGDRAQFVKSQLRNPDEAAASLQRMARTYSRFATVVDVTDNSRNNSNNSNNNNKNVICELLQTTASAHSAYSGTVFAENVRKKVRFLQRLVFDPRVVNLLRSPTSSSSLFPDDYAVAVALVNAFDLLFQTFGKQRTGSRDDDVPVSETRASGSKAAATAATFCLDTGKVDSTDADAAEIRVLRHCDEQKTNTVQCFSHPYSIFPTASPQSRVQIGFISIVVADTPRDLLAFPHIFTDGGFTVVILRQRITDRDQELASLCREVTSDARYPFDPKDPLSCLERPLVFWLRSRQLNGKKPPPVHDLLLISSAKPKRLDEQLRSIGIEHDILLPAERWQREVRHGTRELNSLMSIFALQPVVASSAHTSYWDWEKQRFVGVARFVPMQWAPSVDFEAKRASCTGGLSRWRLMIPKPLSHQHPPCPPTVMLDLHQQTCKHRLLNVNVCCSAFSAQDVIHLDLALALSNAPATPTASTAKPRLFCSGTHYTTIQTILSFLTVFDAMKSLARVNRATWHEFEELRCIGNFAFVKCCPPGGLTPTVAVPFSHYFNAALTRDRCGLAPMNSLQVTEALRRKYKNKTTFVMSRAGAAPFEQGITVDVIHRGRVVLQRDGASIYSVSPRSAKLVMKHTPYDAYMFSRGGGVGDGEDDDASQPQQQRSESVSVLGEFPGASHIYRSMKRLPTQPHIVLLSNESLPSSSPGQSKQVVGFVCCERSDVKCVPSLARC